MNKTELKAKISKLKKEKDAVILAHVYQDYDILDIADITGDSFALAKAATNISAKRVIMCGVYFMAETVKMLSPEKEVILPISSAGCPMAEMLTVKEVADFKAANPDYTVVAYVNTTAELKTLADVCVTSSSAEKILRNMPSEKILFIPDQNLGHYIEKRLPEKHFQFLDGCCPYHNSVTAKDIADLKKHYPDAVVAAHPECRSEVLEQADMIGATTEIIKYATEQSGKVIIATEIGVTDYLNKKYHTDRFIQVAPDKLVCKSMKSITLESVLDAINGEGDSKVIEMDETLRLNAKKSIDAMLFYGNQ